MTERRQSAYGRLEQESRALGRLQHPGIAQIYEGLPEVEIPFEPKPSRD